MADERCLFAAQQTWPDLADLARCLGIGRGRPEWLGRAHDEDHKMPMIDADGCLLNVSVEGRDGGPTLMLSNSLGAPCRCGSRR